jgi:3-dehydroquinate synthase
LNRRSRRPNIDVQHKGGSYAIRFCSLAEAVQRLPEDCVVITDDNVAGLYGDSLPEAITVTAGEASKSTQTWARLQSELVQRGASRRTTVVAFGGGVVGDLAGLVAAAYLRGVPLIQIPTTLLAQVDSSVGGKVGIDLPEGKNLVGAFYPPSAVYVCDETLETLPERELRNGMAEVWKYAFIADDDLVEDIRKKPRKQIVRRCIELKKEVVESDEFETTGRRAILNFGHTIGHAIEQLTGYGPVRHGEAISIGMVAEARLGERLGVTQPGAAKTIEECLRSAGLPTSSVVLSDVDAVIRVMRRDKKATSGRLAFSLIESIGRCKLVEDVSEEEVRAVLRRK